MFYLLLCYFVLMLPMFTHAHHSGSANDCNHYKGKIKGINIKLPPSESMVMIISMFRGLWTTHPYHLAMDLYLIRECAHHAVRLYRNQN